MTLTPPASMAPARPAATSGGAAWTLARIPLPVVLVALAVVYVIAGKLSLRLATVNVSATAVWPPTGIALAALLVLGPRMWPAIFAGAFVVNLTTAGSVVTSLAIAGGNTLEAVLGAMLVRRFASGRDAVALPMGVFKFALLAALVSTAVSATIGVGSLALAGFADWKHFGAIWFTWWLGDGTGALIVGLPLLAWSRGVRLPRLARDLGEGVVLVAVAAAIGWAVFIGAPRLGRAYPPLEFLCLPPVIWAAFRLGPTATTMLTLGLSAIALWGTIHGHGPFAGHGGNRSLLLLQSFMATMMVTAAAVAATVVEWKRARGAMRDVNAALEIQVAERTGQLRLANEELRVGEARLREAQQVAGLGSWEWRVGEDAVWWSDELHRIYGVEPSAFGATYDAFLARLHPADRDLVRAAVATALDRREGYTIEFRVVRPDGEVRVVQSRGRVHVDTSGHVVRLSGTAHDVTEQRRVEIQRQQLFEEQAAREEAEKANRLKDKFLATLAHELRTPLGAITGWVHLLHGGLDAEQTKKALEVIERNAQLQTHLITDLLELSRINSGTIPLQKEFLDLGPVVDAAVDALRPTASEKGVTLAVARSGDATLHGDADRLHQIVTNLLSNAIRFAPAGGSVEVALVRHGDAVRVVVADDGPGIDPENLPQVFEPLWRRDPAAPRAQGGQGLGLAIVRQLVELHGGAVVAANRPERGAAFTVTLPCSELPTRAAVGPAAASAPHDGPALAGVRVLYVEDKEDAREAIRTILAQAGAEVHAVETVREAMAALRIVAFDVVISDLAMPVEDGFDLLRQVRALPASANGEIPAIALTAYTDEDHVRRSHAVGFQHHVAKPVPPDELIALVYRLAAAAPSEEPR